MEKNKNLLHCVACDAVIEEHQAYIGLDGCDYCGDCFNDYYYYCDHCGSLHDVDHVEAVVTGRHDTEYWCSDCIDTDAIRCGDCDKYFSRNYDESCDVMTLITVPNGTDYCTCDECYRNYSYGYCDDCGRSFNTDDLYFDDLPRCHCADCHDEYNIIHDYHDGSRPLLWLGGSSHERQKLAFFGVELEVSHGGESTYNAEKIIKAGGHSADEDITVEHDSSLTRGFELISTTASYEYHAHKYGWEAMMKKADALEYKSHDGGCCGLHVHIDRQYWSGKPLDESFSLLSCLSKRNIKAPEVLSAIILVNNTKWLKTFSRRTNFYYCEFPKLGTLKGWHFNPPLRYKENGIQQVMKLLDALNDSETFRGHCTALNFCNKETIELRFNRGTLKFSTFVAIMQFSQMFADAVKICKTPQQACLINFRWFLKTARRRKYKEFIQYLDERQLLA